MPVIPRSFSGLIASVPVESGKPPAFPTGHRGTASAFLTVRAQHAHQDLRRSGHSRNARVSGVGDTCTRAGDASHARRDCGLRHADRTYPSARHLHLRRGAHGIHAVHVSSWGDRVCHHDVRHVSLVGACDGAVAQSGHRHRGNRERVGAVPHFRQLGRAQGGPDQRARRSAGTGKGRTRDAGRLPVLGQSDRDEHSGLRWQLHLRRASADRAPHLRRTAPECVPVVGSC